MASSLYLNSFLLGMINIIIAAHMVFLTEQLNTDSVGVSSLISAIGIGKIVSLSLTGRLSDKFGRKPLVIIASFSYVIFLVGIPLAPNYTVAFIFAFSAGVSNSIMDSGTYPALIEAFPTRAESASVLLKAFISAGATLLPIMISFFISKNMFYGYTFFVIAFIYVVNGIHLMFVRFPAHKRRTAKEKIPEQHTQTWKSVQPTFWREGSPVFLLGFSSVALFMIIQIWLPTYGQDVVGLGTAEAVGLLSFYSIGGFISIILLAVFLNKYIKSITVLIVYPSIALLSLLLLLLFPNPLAVMVISFLLGLSTAGIFQLAVTIMAEFFPNEKGTSTAYVGLASSTAFIVIPVGTGLLLRHFNVTTVFVFDMFLAIISILLSIIIFKRYKKVFPMAH